MSKSIKYSLILLLTAAIWGAAFVAQSAGMEYVGPYTFNCVRCFLGAFVLLPIIAIKDKVSKEPATKWSDKALWKGGIICGIFLFAASTSQQLGIAMEVPVGKAGFITTFYIVLVPIFSIFLKKKPGKFIWVSVVLAVVGLYFLSMSSEGFTGAIAMGDWLVFACAILFSCQILAVDAFAPGFDCLKLACIQFLVTGLLGFGFMLYEQPAVGDILNAWMSIGYAGFFSCGVAYTLQMVAQKEVKPAVASILMSLESVFSVIFGFLILGQKLKFNEGVGCIIMFIAVLLAQFQPTKGDSQKESSR